MRAAQRVPRRLPICVRLSKDAQEAPGPSYGRPAVQTPLCTPWQAGRTFGFDASILQHASFRQSRSPYTAVLRPQPTYCCLRDAVDGPLLDTSNSRPLATSRRQL